MTYLHLICVLFLIELADFVEDFSPHEIWLIETFSCCFYCMVKQDLNGNEND